MHFIDSANSVEGKWVGWDSQTRARPTLGTPEWFNTMQEEIANVVLAAGLPLDKNDNTQLITAIETLYVDDWATVHMLADQALRQYQFNERLNAIGA